MLREHHQFAKMKEEEKCVVNRPPSAYHSRIEENTLNVSAVS